MNPYAKFITAHQIAVAPSMVFVEGKAIANPKPELLRRLGYKEVIYPAVTPDVEIPEQQAPLREVYTEEADCIRVAYLEAESEPLPDVTQLREAAYRAEADQYLTAYVGYMAEGRTAEADKQKALYLARKTEIRERYPDAENLSDRVI